MKKKNHRISAFTLIELLIVIAIILILIAIALPNFLEAQIRAKVVRVEGDMRGLATALESYFTDYNQYPPDEIQVIDDAAARGNPPPPLDLRALTALTALTTPVAYMTDIVPNPFPNETDNQADRLAYYRYFAERWKEDQLTFHPTWPRNSKSWSLASAGPDLESNVGEYLMFGQMILESIPGSGFWGPGSVYSATNGTRSAGDIVRVGP
ncbi:MAG: prepilin-type N-terminal cleavage/methylation domain-containing protein [Candidatus Omnitrophica bacterium]|nr:prepilin-type N-terminal cleavage/methylation domain-containing protein [Candidatus Omnitrophota bacterium]MCA9414765.1 prepilin-type N-terminal cleavage/methylation domain-containing protein [Candidatus Omnitrophota bacterium]MCA9432208.1 prepilin-type N-terminal cleavage/methylation domain-containing protein [Candidatus Omnitrophota bacterium]MCA9441686.1 prepilin-type N-terminal cleavage/methylation domain-containing protein [Candidatus Omnitrophota bacterium]MCB9768995.1 prepilin-type N-